MKASYKVLARAYRPVSFEDSFMGQETTVQILSNAIEAGQLPHAIIFSGIRGVGKTTTARILARTINCSNLTFENKKPKPCGICNSCTALLKGDCLDVVEMDAASRTSVEDIRDLIESLPYKPLLCKYKVYIIDEVHMLSKSAFNALLKTLEEPPEHIKFIFATTELHKIPATILSRCMRFNLRAFTKEELKAYLQRISKKENIYLEEKALDLVVEAARGSARDALSLLDQARHLDNKIVTTDQMRSMLGKADFLKVLSLFENILEGKVSQVFFTLPQFYQEGSNAQELSKSLLDIIYQLNKIRVAAAAAQLESFSKSEQEYLHRLAKDLTTPLLQSLWQVTAKGYEDIRRSPLPEAAFEMLIIRLMHVKEVLLLPLSETPASPLSSEGQNISSMHAIDRSPKLDTTREEKLESFEEEHSKIEIPPTFESLLCLLREKKEPLLASHLMQDVHLISYEPFKLNLKLTDHAPKDLCRQLKERLKNWTGKEWTVEQSKEGGAATLYQQKEEKLQTLKKKASQAPLVKEVLEAFPGAKVVKISPILHNA